MINWDAISAVADILGAAGVIASLIYLAIQIKLQNKESRISASRELTTAYREAASSVHEAQVAAVLVKAIGPHELNAVEKVQLTGMFQRYFRVWEQAHYQYGEGYLEEQAWVAMNTHFLDIMSIPAIQAIWAVRKAGFRANFVAYVDGQTYGSFQGY